MSRIAAAAAALLLCALPATASAASGINKIRHVVVVMQENRSFDSYFGTYPKAAGIPGLAGNRGKVPCVPDPKHGGCVKPFHDSHDVNFGGPHEVQAFNTDINGEKMDGFIKARQTCTALAAPEDCEADVAAGRKGYVDMM